MLSSQYPGAASIEEFYSLPVIMFVYFVTQLEILVLSAALTSLNLRYSLYDTHCQSVITGRSGQPHP